MFGSMLVDKQKTNSTHFDRKRGMKKETGELNNKGSKGNPEPAPDL